MNGKITPILNRANNVAISQAADARVFINEQGTVSDRSGLGFFKRHFSKSARIAENRATLDAFFEAIRNSPEYCGLINNTEVTRFFLDKYGEGSPLTALEVKQVLSAKDMDRALSVGRDLAGAGVINSFDATSFAWFCMGKGLDLGSPDTIKDALKQYLANDFDNAARQALAGTGLRGSALESALPALKQSGIWSSALDKAFQGNLSALDHDTIMNNFRDAVAGPALFLQKIDADAPLGRDSLRSLTGGEAGLALLGGVFEAVAKGNLDPDQGAAFVAFCTRDRLDTSTPEALHTAFGRFAIHHDAARLFTDIARKEGLPPEIGPELARNGEFMEKALKRYTETFPPPALPPFGNTAAPEVGAFDGALEELAENFFAEKAADIRDLLAVPGKHERFPSDFTDKSNILDQNFICKALNPLLVAQQAMRGLIAPGSEPDSALIQNLEDIMHAETSLFPAGAGEDEKMVFLERLGFITLAALAPDAERPETVLGNAIPKLHSICSGLLGMAQILFDSTKGHDSEENSTLVRVASFGAVLASSLYKSVPQPDREIPGIPKNHKEFTSSIYRMGSGKHAVHPSVCAYAASIGINVRGVPGKAADQAENVARAYTGTRENPELTPLLRERAKAVATELGFTSFNVDALNPAAVGNHLAAAVLARNVATMTPEQAGAVAEEALRQYMADLKPIMDEIEKQPEGAAKEALRRLVPGSPLRDPGHLNSLLQGLRQYTSNLGILVSPNATDEAITRSLTDIGVTLNTFITSCFPDAPGDVRKDMETLIFTLALDALELPPENLARLPETVLGMTGYLVCIADDLSAPVPDKANPDAPAAPDPDRAGKGAALRAVAGSLDTLRLTLARRMNMADAPAEVKPADIRDVPAAVFDALSRRDLRITMRDLHGYAALALLTPPLSHAQWDSLAPVLEMVGASFSDNTDYNDALKLVTANAPELLKKIETNHGEPLRPEQIWEVVLGDSAPEDTTAENVGRKIFDAATSRMTNRVLAAQPEIDEFYLSLCVKPSWSLGIPFQAAYNAYQPGGSLSLADVRFSDSLELPSLADYTAEKAYALPRDWPRRRGDPTGKPSQMTIYGRDGAMLLTLPHQFVPDAENTATYPPYTAIIANCQGFCHSDAQFQRVMQSLSQASTRKLRDLCTSFPHLSISEHSHMDSTVTPQSNGNVVVKLANGPNDMPAAHIEITVTPDGTATITDIGITLPGEPAVAPPGAGA